MAETTLAAQLPHNFSQSTSARPKTNHAVWYALLVALIVIAFLAEVTIGAVRIPLSAIWQLVTGGQVEKETWSNILFAFRFPRAVNALFSGAALGACGLLLQTLFRNPLADPFVLGVMHGSRLGVAILVVTSGLAGNAFLYKYGVVGDVGIALASALGSTLVLLLLAALAKRVSTVTLLIVGLMLGYLCVGLISVILHFIDETQAQAFGSWDDGSFAGATRQQLSILLPGIVVGIALASVLVKPLNALLLGENYAQSLGLNVTRIKRLGFIATGLLAGVVTAYCGPIAFLGIVAAHLGRGMFRTSDHRVLMPGVLLLGGLLGLSCDLITHLPWSRHFLHLNAVNGLIGAPLVLWALLNRKRGIRFE